MIILRRLSSFNRLHGRQAGSGLRGSDKHGECWGRGRPVVIRAVAAGSPVTLRDSAGARAGPPAPGDAPLAREPAVRLPVW